MTTVDAFFLINCCNSVTQKNNYVTTNYNELKVNII